MVRGLTGVRHAPGQPQGDIIQVPNFETNGVRVPEIARFHARPPEVQQDAIKAILIAGNNIDPHIAGDIAQVLSSTPTRGVRTGNPLRARNNYVQLLARSTYEDEQARTASRRGGRSRPSSRKSVNEHPYNEVIREAEEFLTEMEHEERGAFLQYEILEDYIDQLPDTVDDATRDAIYQEMERICPEPTGTNRVDIAAYVAEFQASVADTATPNRLGTLLTPATPATGTPTHPNELQDLVTRFGRHFIAPTRSPGLLPEFYENVSGQARAHFEPAEVPPRRDEVTQPAAQTIAQQQQANGPAALQPTPTVRSVNQPRDFNGVPTHREIRAAVDGYYRDLGTLKLSHETQIQAIASGFNVDKSAAENVAKMINHIHNGGGIHQFRAEDLNILRNHRVGPREQLSFIATRLRTFAERAQNSFLDAIPNLTEDERNFLEDEIARAGTSGHMRESAREMRERWWNNYPTIPVGDISTLPLPNDVQAPFTPQSFVRQTGLQTLRPVPLTRGLLQRGRNVPDRPSRADELSQQLQNYLHATPTGRDVRVQAIIRNEGIGGVLQVEAPASGWDSIMDEIDRI